MTANVHALQRSARGVGRCGAILAAGSALLHAAGLSQGCAPTPLTVLMNLMILACLACAWHLWTRPTPRAWAVTGVMSAVMVIVHTVLMRGSMHHGSMMLGPATFGAVLEIALSIAVIQHEAGVRRRAGRISIPAAAPSALP
ncbi:hypothetical protein [Nocardia sp. NBC_01327]|uniref:hypothetical protein n=1 Tax=Nocardia sp. NBC_01327 TaxID=2903593 RepID=UPI002E1284D8|nr:hypothetical protein OG326_20455 [Nocardia sp. NBC_01327]